MRKTLITTIAMAILVFGVQPVMAYTFPSTNQLNKDQLVPGREGQKAPYVNLVESSLGKVTLDFVGGYTGGAFFEYRIDGEAKTSGTTHPITGDYIYPGVWVIANNTVQREFEANEYVEVRLALGGERDWDFDWTRFDVLFNRTAEIISPEAGSVVSGNVSFDAVLTDKDQDDSVQWAVREGTCAAGTGTVAGNVDGFNDAFYWEHTTFHALVDTSSWDDGDYCFVFNPSESAGDTAIRLTSEFTINNTPDDKDQCKNGGWETFFTPSFKNQGDCVSFIQSNGHAIGNKAK